MARSDGILRQICRGRVQTAWRKWEWWKSLQNHLTKCQSVERLCQWVARGEGNALIGWVCKGWDGNVMWWDGYVMWSNGNTWVGLAAGTSTTSQVNLNRESRHLHIRNDNCKFLMVRTRYLTSLALRWALHPSSNIGRELRCLFPVTWATPSWFRI